MISATVEPSSSVAPVSRPPGARSTPFHSPSGLPLLFMTLGALTLPWGQASAQAFSLGRVSIEPRLGVAFPTGDFGDIDPTCAPRSTGCPFPVQVGTETGWRWGIRIDYALRSRLVLFGEYGKANLRCSAAFCGSTHQPGTRSLGAGLRAVPMSLGGMDLWVEGATVLERATIIRSVDREGNRDPSPVDYPWSLGFSGGVGAELPLTGGYDLFFTPGFRFRYVPADPPNDHADLASVTATYMLFEVGFRVALGQ